MEQQHISRETFKNLQKFVDQLLAMYLVEHNVFPSQLSVLELIQWAYQKSQQQEAPHA